MMKDAMKLVFILPASGRTGGIRSTVVASNILLERGHRVRILYRKSPITIRGFYRSIVIPLLYRGNYDWLQTFKGKINSFKDIDSCSFEDGEVIIGAGIQTSSLIMDLDSVPNRKLQYLHGENITNPKETDKVLKSPLPKIVVSSFLKPLIESHGSKVLGIIANGVDQREYYNSVNDLDKDGIGTIYYSHLSKDPATTLAVLERISKQKPHLPIRIFSSHRRPKTIKRNSFWRLPSVEKVREIYSRSMVWILASRSEGFGIPILEAMACGCAVVATDCGGPRDIINDGKNGFLVEVGNVQQIVDRVLMLISDDNLRERICIEAKKTVDEFSWDISADQLEKVLKSLTLSHCTKLKGENIN